MGVGRWGLVRLRGWGKEGAGSQPWMDLRMERKKETEESERERKEGGGKKRRRGKRQGESGRDKDRRRWVVDGERDGE